MQSGVCSHHDYDIQDLTKDGNDITLKVSNDTKKNIYIIPPVDNCHGTTIVTSDCTIVTSEQHLYQTIVQ